MRDPWLWHVLKAWLADRLDDLSVAIATPVHAIRWQLHRWARRLRA